MLCLCIGSGSDKHNVISLQVDYESEEENGEENVKETPEDEEAESEKEEGTPGAEEDQNRAEGEDSQHLSFVSQSKKGKDHLLQSAEVRVSAVVESHPSIQGYTFDTENELWCEVRWNICGLLYSGCMGSSHKKWIFSGQCCCLVSAIPYEYRKWNYKCIFDVTFSNFSFSEHLM